jgi:hypothetical protein
MIAFITVCQGECECQGNENEKLAAETARVDPRKSDRVLAKIFSPSI